MRYILSDTGYIDAIAFGATIECKNKSCTEYTGTVPSGYTSLCEWADNANIRAYKIVDGNLVFDEEEDDRLQEEYDNGSWEELKPVNGTWNYLRYKKEGNHVTVEGHASSYDFSKEQISVMFAEMIPSSTKYTYAFLGGSRIARLYFNTNGIIGINWAVTLTSGEAYTGTSWLQFRIEYEV